MIFTFMAFCLVACGQTKNGKLDKSVDFSKIIEHFEEYAKHSKDTIVLPLLHENKEYRIEISDTPILFDLKEIVIKSPFDKPSDRAYGMYYKYPISFSVIYQNRLISLFERGEFVCHTIPSMKRDIEFEKEINTKKFEYHWIIDGKLVGRVEDKYYFLDSENKWIKYDRFIPFKNQPKLFEDNDYISFCNCRGEWGGTVYFYNKLTEKIYFTGATCANSIQKKDKYLVLSHLAHEGGSSDLRSIEFPDNLSQTDIDEISAISQGELWGHIDKYREYKIVFDYYFILIFSSFPYQGKTIYMVYWYGKTFLAEIENNVIKIINPLFNRDLFASRPITTTYNDTVLINLDSYMIAGNREIACVIIKDGQLIKFDWNEMHSR